MRKVSTVMYVIFLLSTSCSKKDDPVVECLLTKMVSTQPISVFTVTNTFEYDGDRRLVKVNEVSSYPGTPTTISAFSYVNGMVAMVKVESMTVGSLATSATFTWTNDGSRVSKIDGPTSQVLTYGSDGNLKTSTSISYGISTTQTFTFSGDLQSVNTVSVNPVGPVKADYSYGTFDGQKSQYTLLAKAINQPFYIHQGFLLSPQNFFIANPFSYRFVLTLPGSAPQTTDTTYEYEYNAKGYPTKITEQIGGHINRVTTLEYKDCN